MRAKRAQNEKEDVNTCSTSCRTSIIDAFMRTFITIGRPFAGAVFSGPLWTLGRLLFASAVGAPENENDVVWKKLVVSFLGGLNL